MSDDNNDNTPAIDPNTVRELERARSDLKDLRAKYKTAQDDADKFRGERDTLRTQFEAYQTESTSKLAEATAAIERAKAEHESALTEIRTAGDRAVLLAEAKAVATRLGAHDPADVVNLIDLSGVTRDEDGQFVGLTEALDAAKAAKGYLFGEPPQTGAQSGTTTPPVKAPPRGRPPKVNAREIEAANYEAEKAKFLRGTR